MISFEIVGTSSPLEANTCTLGSIRGPGHTELLVPYRLQNRLPVALTLSQTQHILLRSIFYYYSIHA
jgi:hypothetical protein